MSLRFALAEGRLRPRLSPAGARAALAWPANDNGEDEAANREVLRAALKHFARHGIGAADHARSEAEKAFFAGERESYRWWLGVCRTLDRRMAANLARKTDNDASAAPL